MGRPRDGTTHIGRRERGGRRRPVHRLPGEAARRREQLPREVWSRVRTVTKRPRFVQGANRRRPIQAASSVTVTLAHPRTYPITSSAPGRRPGPGGAAAVVQPGANPSSAGQRGARHQGMTRRPRRRRRRDPSRLKTDRGCVIVLAQRLPRRSRRSPAPPPSSSPR